MLGLFTKIHHTVPNKTTTRSRLVQTVNSVIWSCIVVPCNAVSKIQCRQKELENPSPQCALHLLLTAQTGQQEVQTHHPPTTSCECKSFAIQEVWPPNNSFFLKSYYYIKKLGSHGVWTSIQFISTLSKFLFPSGFVSKICSNFKLQNKTEAVPYLIWYYLVKAPFFSWKK